MKCPWCDSEMTCDRDMLDSYYGPVMGEYYDCTTAEAAVVKCSRPQATIIPNCGYWYEWFCGSEREATR